MGAVLVAVILVIGGKQTNRETDEKCSSFWVQCEIERSQTVVVVAASFVVAFRKRSKDLRGVRMKSVPRTEYLPG